MEHFTTPSRRVAPPQNFDFDEDYEDFLDEIAEIENERMPIDKQNNQYYIGTYLQCTRHSKSVTRMNVSITPQTFFEYDITDVENYLFNYYYTPRHEYKQNTIEIMKLIITQDGMYLVVLKTFWLRIIQKKWRRFYSLLRARGSLHMQHQFELTGKWRR